MHVAIIAAQYSSDLCAAYRINRSPLLELASLAPGAAQAPANRPRTGAALLHQQPWSPLNSSLGGGRWQHIGAPLDNDNRQSKSQYTALWSLRGLVLATCFGLIAPCWHRLLRRAAHHAASSQHQTCTPIHTTGVRLSSAGMPWQGRLQGLALPARQTYLAAWWQVAQTSIAALSTKRKCPLTAVHSTGGGTGAYAAAGKGRWQLHRSVQNAWCGCRHVASVQSRPSVP